LEGCEQNIIQKDNIVANHHSEISL
jgi:hypothetical protein